MRTGKKGDGTSILITCYKATKGESFLSFQMRRLEASISNIASSGEFKTLNLGKDEINKKRIKTTKHGNSE
jgi:hypothetical protein